MLFVRAAGATPGKGEYMAAQALRNPQLLASGNDQTHRANMGELTQGPTKATKATKTTKAQGKNDPSSERQEDLTFKKLSKR